MLAAARAAGVPRTVHTSSVAAIGVRGDGLPADEAYQSPPERLIGAYKRSKYFAELEARHAFAAGQDVVIVNPTTPVGPWDAKPTPTGEILVRFLNRRMPAYVDTGLNLVDVRDVAVGHVLAYERGRAGERYILGNENLTLRALLDRLAELTGLPAPRVRLPRAIPLAYAALGELVFARLGIAPDVALDSVRMAKQRMFYTTEKAACGARSPAQPRHHGAGRCDLLVSRARLRDQRPAPLGGWMAISLKQAVKVGSYVVRQRLAGRKQYPLVLMLEPLFRCNLACGGCGKIQHPVEVLRRHLTPEQCFAAVDECGAPVVSIPGGEPLLHPQIDEIVRGLVARKKFVYLCTNAIRLEASLGKFTSVVVSHVQRPPGRTARGPRSCGRA